MKRIIITFFFTVFVFKVISQPTFKIDSQIITVNQSVCNAIQVDNFKDILTSQFTLSWDPTVVQFDSVSNMSLIGMSKNNFGLSKISQGILSFSWFDGNATGKSLADGSILFSVCFKSIGLPGESSPVEIISSPIKVEVTDINSNGNDIGSMIQNGSITIENKASSLNIEELILASGSSWCTHFTATGVNALTILKSTLSWNPEIAHLDSICCLHTNLSSSNFNQLLTDNGKLLIQYELPTPIDLTSNTLLAGFCFTALGLPDTVTTLLADGSYIPLEIKDELGNSVPVSGSKIIIKPNDLVINIKNKIAVNGAKIKIPLIIEISGQLKSYSGNLSFPAQGLIYSGIFSTKIQGFVFDPISVINGTATLSWSFKNIGNSTQVSKGDTLFAIELLLNGAPGDQLTISLNDHKYPLHLKIENGKIYDLNVLKDTAIIFILPQTANLEIGHNVGAQYDIICLPVIVENFTNISGFELFFLSDPTILQPIELIDQAFPIDLTTTVSLSDSIISIKWGSSSNSNIFDLPKGSEFAKVCYQLIGQPGSNSAITLNAGSLYFLNELGDYQNYFSSNAGEIKIGEDILNVESDVTNNQCSSQSSGSIHLNINGGKAPISFVWSNGSNLQNISSLSDGQYTVTIADSSSPPQTKELFFKINHFHENPKFSPILDTSIPCPNQSVLVYADNPDLFYIWSGTDFMKSNTSSIELDKEGEYVIEAIDKITSCSSKDTFIVFPPPALESAFVSESFITACDEVVLESIQTIGVTGFWSGSQALFDKIDENKTLATNINEGLQYFVWTISTDQCINYSSDTCWIYKRKALIASNDQIVQGANDYNILLNDVLNPGNVFLTFGGSLPNGLLINDIGDVTIYPSFDHWDSVIIYRICDPVCTDFCAEGTISFVENADTIINIPNNSSVSILPNAISPNGDGFNDRLFFTQIESGRYPQAHLVVFDKSGKTVADVKSYVNDWIGTTHDGRELPMDTYYFVLYLDLATNNILKGPVTILK